MKEILEVLIKNLVEDKDLVSINETNKDNNFVYEVKVSEKDMGRVIGKQGRMAKSIRTVMKAMATKENKKITIEFVD